MKIAFITDEVTQSFDEAVRFALACGISGLELRSVEDTPIDRIPETTLRAWRQRLDAEHLTVCSLSSTFYKCSPDEEHETEELAKLERLCDAADILGCPFIRGFAFFAPESGPLLPEALASRFERPAALLAARGKTLLLEADPSVNTSNHAALARLLEAIGSEHIRAVFDPGNCMYDPLGETPYPDGYEAIRPYFVHVHIKDAVRAQPETYCVKVGTGQVGYPALLRRLAQDGYDGWLSMETHYRKDSRLTEEQLRLPGGAGFSAGGAAATAECIDALKELLRKEGIA